MEVALPVHVGQCLQGLKGDVADLVMRQFASLLQQLEDVAVQVLEDKEQLVVLLDDFDKFDDIGVVQFGQDTHLVKPHAFIPILVLMLHPFDGNHLTGLLVDSLHHASETAVSQLAAYSVFLHLNTIMQWRSELPIRKNIIRQPHF
jgi:hypothetical protein